MLWIMYHGLLWSVHVGFYYGMMVYGSTENSKSACNVIFFDSSWFLLEITIFLIRICCQYKHWVFICFLQKISLQCKIWKTVSFYRKWAYYLLESIVNLYIESCIWNLQKSGKSACNVIYFDSGWFLSNENVYQ